MKTITLDTQINGFTFAQSIKLGLFLNFFKANRDLVISKEALKLVENMQNEEKRSAILSVNKWRMENPKQEFNASCSYNLTKSYYSQHTHSTMFGVFYGY